MDFCPRLNFSLTVFVLSLYLVEEAQCPESKGSCSSDDGTSCEETGSPGQLFSSHVSGLNGTFILGKQPQRQTSDADYYSSAVYISVKTTVSYHESRLAVLLLTWLQTVRPKQVHIVTDLDSDDQWTTIARKAGFSVFEADCSVGHQRKALCCKSGVEYKQYYAARENGEQYQWFCHFDDDIYVNVPALVATLMKYNATEGRWYLGRWSVNRKEKIEIPVQKLKAFPDHKSSSYYFATGAAYCISSSLMDELEPYLRGTAFEVSGQNLQLPDDMVVGALVDAILGHELTEVNLMNSHLNGLARIKPDDLKKQITISYGEFKVVNKPVIKNLVNIPNAVFDEEADPTRFLSYHCHLYPSTQWCNSK